MLCSHLYSNSVYSAKETADTAVSYLIFGLFVRSVSVGHLNNDGDQSALFQHFLCWTMM